MKQVIYLLAIGFFVMGCTSTSKLPTKSVAYKTLYDEKPLSVLILPPINKSVKVEAKELFYSSLLIPLTQKGYYTLPPLLSMEILKEESAYDAELFLNNSMKRVGELFGVDAVLFTIIHEWSKTTIASQIRVKIEYQLKSTKTDEILFNRIGDVTLSTSSNSGNLLVDMVASMAATALTKEIVVGRNCNLYTLTDIPNGKYSPDYLKDGELPSGKREFKAVIRQ